MLEHDPFLTLTVSQRIRSNTNIRILLTRNLIKMKNNNSRKKTNNSDKTRNVLESKLTNEWIKIGMRMPDPKPLYRTIWHQGEVGILFANTGKGKSILAMQLADSISRERTVSNVYIPAQKVVYCDFELSTKAFQRRYSTAEDSYCFSDMFIRAEIDRNQSLEDKNLTFEELVMSSVKENVNLHQADVLIIDNITYLSATNEKSHEAMALMKLILDLARGKNISILLIAHTPKRDIYSPIQLEDLAGSKALSNFVDFCFCIGESTQGDNVRYIKQLKNRNYPIEYGAENVINCELVKEDSFLHFNCTGYGSEKDHLQSQDDDDKKQKLEELVQAGKTNKVIGKFFDVDERTIRRWRKKWDIS